MEKALRDAPPIAINTNYGNNWINSLPGKNQAPPIDAKVPAASRAAKSSAQSASTTPPSSLEAQIKEQKKKKNLGNVSGQDSRQKNPALINMEEELKKKVLKPNLKSVSDRVIKCEEKKEKECIEDKDCEWKDGKCRKKKSDNIGNEFNIGHENMELNISLLTIHNLIL